MIQVLDGAANGKSKWFENVSVAISATADLGEY